MNKAYFMKETRFHFIDLAIDVIDCCTTFFMAFLSGSLFLLMDALDSLNSVAFSGTMLYTCRRLAKDESYAYDYGLGKYEALSSFLCTLLLLFSTLFVSALAIWRLFTPQPVETLTFVALLYKTGVLLLDAFLYLKHRLLSKEQNSHVFATTQNALLKHLLFDICAITVLLLSFIFRDFLFAFYIQPIACLALAAYLFMIYLPTLKKAAADLLDKTLTENIQLQIVTLLAKYIDKYDEFYGVRTRQVGSSLYIDLLVNYAPNRSGNEIRTLSYELATAVEQHIPNSVVSIVLYQPTISEDLV